MGRYLTLLFFMIYFNVSAQNHNPDVGPAGNIYQIKLTDSVKCIQLIEYEKTGEPVKGYLDDNKTLIYLEDYKVNNKVRLKVIFENGREQEIMRSPCSIELKYSL